MCLFGLYISFEEKIKRKFNTPFSRAVLVNFNGFNFMKILYIPFDGLVCEYISINL